MQTIADEVSAAIPGDASRREQVIIQFPDIYSNLKGLTTKFMLCYVISNRISLINDR